MNIDVEAFGLYLVVVVAGVALLWAVWPSIWPKKKEELKLDPESTPTPAPESVVEAAPPAPEPVVEAAPVVEQAPAPKKAAKKISSKKAPTPAAKKAPVKKATKK